MFLSISAHQLSFGIWQTLSLQLIIEQHNQMPVKHRLRQKLLIIGALKEKCFEASVMNRDKD